MKIQEYVPLKNFTTMRVGGNARFFCRIKTENDLEEAFKFIKKEKVNFFILGSGSNIIFSDDIFDGVVIKMEIGGVKYSEKDELVFVSAGAGVLWDFFVEETVNHGLYGLENLSFIPGTVGASSVQNIGAYGVEAKDTIDSVIVFNTDTKKFETFSNKECKFDYRNSFFKTKKGKKYIVVRVTFLLSKKELLNLSYVGLQKTLEECGITQPTLQEVRDVIIKIRKKKLPEIKEIGSAGSFFKNPIILKKEYKALVKRFPQIPYYTVDCNMVKVPAGWLIDNVCNLKGKRKGDVGTYCRQALIIVNYGNASSTEIKNFAEKIVVCVKKETGIKLEREVLYIK